MILKSGLTSVLAHTSTGVSNFGDDFVDVAVDLGVSFEVLEVLFMGHQAVPSPGALGSGKSKQN